MSRSRFLAPLVIAALLPLGSMALHAQNAKQLTSGTTTLTLDSNLLLGLQAASITVTPAAPATGTSNSATFPVATGAVDMDTLVGVVYTSGGLTFSSSNTSVTVSQFAILAQPNHEPVMYALVTLNGKVEGLVGAFNIGGDLANSSSGTSLTLNNLSITLSQLGANLLNTSFGISDFAGGQAVGTANLSGTVGPLGTGATAKR